MDSSYNVSFINKNLPKFYSFAHALVPDELQAQQIVLDAISLILKGLQEDDSEISTHSLFNRVLDSIYRIGKKRYEQLAGGFFHGTEEPPFYKSTSEERAALFLKHRLSLTNQEIVLVLNIELEQLYELLAGARHRIYEAYHGKPFSLSGVFS